VAKIYKILVRLFARKMTRAEKKEKCGLGVGGKKRTKQREKREWKKVKQILGEGDKQQTNIQIGRKANTTPRRSAGF
jgi:hypothetical protein